MRQSVRHGDVLLTPVDSIPADATPLPHRIVAEGEVTGHAHRLSSGRLLESTSGQRFVDAGESCEITHEEHNTGTLTGLYLVTIQREYDDENEWSQVAD